MDEDNKYKDSKKYIRTHSNLEHRKIAYEEVYRKNREKYQLRFREYQVHHKDNNKENNDPSNLELLTPEQHRNKHGVKVTEIKKIYWTNGKLRQGIISLHKEGIIIYQTKKIILFGNINLRESVYAKLDFKDIKNITCKVFFLSKNHIRIYLNKSSFENLTKKHNKLVQHISKLNEEKVLYFETSSDSKDEIKSFVDLANDLLQSKN